MAITFSSLAVVYWSQVNGYWLECQGLPNKLKDWEAYITLKHRIASYREVFPILEELSGKVVILPFSIVIIQVA